MATVTKDFRVKNGLVVEGSTATVNGHDVLTESLVDAKGDLLVASGADAVTRLAAGTNGYVLTANSSATNGLEWAAAPAVGSFETSIVFEGATADSFETTLAVTDATADRTITLPDVSGTVITTGDSGTVTSAMIENGTIVNGDISASAEIAQSKISGLTTDLGNKASSSDLTTHTGATEAHGATGAVVGTTNSQTLTNKTLTSPVVSGLIISDSSIVLEGATANDHETTLTVTDPTADRTITFPDATGTVQLRVTDVSDTEIGYLNGVTSAIQTQLDAKFATANASTTNISEGTNLYFTDERAQDAVGNSVGNGLDYDDTSGAISVDPSEFALTSVGAPTGNLSLATYKITSLGTPTDATDAATKAYVDSVTEGLHIHEAAVAATTANVNLANALENGDVLDGITLATGNRVLVKNQSTASENGIYVVQASGQPTRATDFDTAAEVDSGDFIFVYSGTVNASTGWVQTNRPATIGTDAINFTQFSGAGTYLAGNGLTLTGNTFTINTGVTVDLNTAQTLTNKSISGSANTLTNIPNNALSNSAITINGTSVSLGGTRTLGTDDISEGSTNKYFSNELAQDAIGNALGSGLSYNDSTGAISVDTTTIQARVADVSDTEIGYLNGVTSAIQTQLNDKAPLVSPSFTTPNIGAASGTSLDLTSHITFSDALMGSATQALTDTSATVVDSWSATTYSTAKYIVQMTNGNDIEVLEVLVTIDGNDNVYLTEYANIISNASIGTTDADFSGGNVRLKVTSTNGTTVKVHKTLIEA
jgi:hypothetical protein